MTDQESEILSRYELLLRLTERMHVAASAEDWPSVVALEVERSTHIAALQHLDSLIVPQNTAYLSEKQRLLERTIDADQSLLNTCKERRRELEEIIRSFPAYRKAAKSYDDNR